MPGDGDVPRFGLGEIGVERQCKEPLPPTPGRPGPHFDLVEIP